LKDEEGLNNRRFRILKDAKGHGKGRQLRLKGFLHEDRGEPENNVEAPSITSTSERGRNDVKGFRHQFC